MAEKMAKALAAEARPVPVPPRPAPPPAESKVAGITQELPVVSMSELDGKPAANIPLTESVSPSTPVPAAPLPPFGNGEPAAVQHFPAPASAASPDPEPAA